MASIADKMRKARQRQVEAGGFKFTIRRPTDLEASRLGKARTEDLLAYVVGWSDVMEIHLVPGGTSVEVPWDEEVCREFLADRPDLWDPLATAVLTLYTEHVAALEDATKN